jgi:hypothetical protein
MADVRKKVVVRKLGGEVRWGYLPPTGFVQDGVVEMLDVDSRVIRFDLKEIRWIATVRDFNLDDAVEPEQIGRRAFLGRPRGDGLWLKVAFFDGETLEGLSHFGVNFLDGVVEDGGIRVTPPEARSNTQSLFIPRSAIQSIEALGSVAAPAKRKARREELEAAQPGLFE